MEIHLARMLGYDQIEPGKTTGYRVPIECVFTKVVTPASSLHRRLRTGENPAYYGLDTRPHKDEVVFLPETITTWSTKIEAGGDVYRTLKEMAKAGGLVGREANRLKELTIAGAEALSMEAAKAGLVLADGKFEFVLGPGRNLLFADSVYTWDENRWLYQLPNYRWVDLSKQVARNAYNIQGEWKRALKEAQKQYPQDKSRWPSPPDMGEDVRELFARASAAVRFALTDGREAEHFVKDVAQRVADGLDRLKDKYHRDELEEEV